MVFKNIRSRFKKKENTQSKAEIEEITTELIEETKKVLQIRFDELMSQHTKPLSEDEARVILNGLIKEAIAKRKIMTGRIEKSVETGALFDRYYGKMQNINALTNSAYAQMQKMDRAKERYDFQKEIYKKLTGRMYIPYALPDDKAIAKKVKTPKKDVWEIIDASKKVTEEENLE